MEATASGDIKTCNRCGLEKELGEFSRNRNNPDGLSRECRQCMKTRLKTYRGTASGKRMLSFYQNRNREQLRIVALERSKTDAARDKKFKRQYGISLAEYNVELRKRKGCCDVCGGKVGRKSSAVLHLDHCHKTNRIRGFLCHLCNMAIGYAKDDPERLRKLALYLDRQAERHKAIAA